MDGEREYVGHRIRRLRELKGLSLRYVAERAELTSSLISQVERNVTSPSVLTLRKIAAALEIPVTSFFESLFAPEEAVVRKHARKRLRTAGGRVEFELVTPDLNRQIELLLCHLDPGGESCEEPAAHEGEECTLVLGGEVEVTVGDQLYRLDDGDSIYLDSRKSHKYRNVGATRVTLICSVYPPMF